jgi:hypothetical protein
VPARKQQNGEEVRPPSSGDASPHPLRPFALPGLVGLVNAPTSPARWNNSG